MLPAFYILIPDHFFLRIKSTITKTTSNIPLITILILHLSN